MMAGLEVEKIERLYLPDSFVIRTSDGFFLYRPGIWGCRKWGREILCALEFFTRRDAEDWAAEHREEFES
jgi:hypothetical protein